MEGDVMTGLSPDADLRLALGDAFETFEAIRQLARRYEDRSPDLLPPSCRPRWRPLTAGTRSSQRTRCPRGSEATDPARRHRARIRTR
jgi:hypothetical protein